MHRTRAQTVAKACRAHHGARCAWPGVSGFGANRIVGGSALRAEDAQIVLVALELAHGVGPLPGAGAVVQRRELGAALAPLNDAISAFDFAKGVDICAALLLSN